MGFLDIELPPIGPPPSDEGILSAEERATLHAPSADLHAWLVAAGRCLRGMPPLGAIGRAVRSACGDAAWSAKQDDVAMVIELAVRSIGERIDGHAERGELDGWDFVRERDDLESLRRGLEEVERRVEDEATGEFVARELDGLVVDLRDFDAWADDREDELRASCGAVPIPDGFYERVRAVDPPGERTWWSALTAAALVPRMDRGFARRTPLFPVVAAAGSGAGVSVPPMRFEHGLEVTFLRDPADRWVARLRGMAGAPGEGRFGLRWTNEAGAVGEAMFPEDGIRAREVVVDGSIVDAVELEVVRGSDHFALVREGEEE